MRNTNRATKHPAVVIFAVLRLLVGAVNFGYTDAILRRIAVIEPVIRIKNPVLDDRVGGAMECIGARLG